MYANKRRKICNIVFAVIVAVTVLACACFLVYLYLEMDPEDHAEKIGTALAVIFSPVLLGYVLLVETVIFGSVKYLLRDREDRKTGWSVFFLILMIGTAALFSYSVASLVAG